MTFLQNAWPSSVIPQDIKDYLSLRPDGKPVKTTLSEDHTSHTDEEWEIKDYVEIPELQNRKKLQDNEQFNYI